MQTNIFPADLDAGGLRITLVVSRFNEAVTTLLRDGARRALAEHGAGEADLTEVRVPGCLELPLAARALIETGRCDAIVALGCVIRGETSHHLYVAGEAARGLAQLSHETGVPIGFGVLTVDTLEQAVARADPARGNKGAEAALTAVEMANLLKSIREGT